jgi:hydroxymethylpyrimidine pyrophosphatase-like HAD family hydrolase
LGVNFSDRIALSVAAGVAPDVAARLRTKLHEKGVEAQLVFSGDGEWRYLDVLAKNAGKYNAMEYVRNLFGISRDRTVACGDSGNDVLMLEGPQRSICVGHTLTSPHHPHLTHTVITRTSSHAGRPQISTSRTRKPL